MSQTIPNHLEFPYSRERANFAVQARKEFWAAKERDALSIGEYSSQAKISLDVTSRAV